MTLTRLFEEVARSRPSDLALVSSRGACSYGELLARSGRVARALRALGVGREVPVGVRVPRSIESVVAVLGVLRAGGAYVPIDPAYPTERQRMMATDAGVRALVVASALAPSADAWGADIATVDVSRLDEGTDDSPLDSPVNAPEDLLYILYTSGSTGRPKGVCGTHAATLNRLRWGWQAFPFAHDDVVGHRSSLSFVDAAPELFSGLLQGVPTAVLLPEEQADLGRFVAALKQHRVTRLTVVPSILASLVRSVPALGRELGHVRLWVTSGEELTLALFERFRAAHPSATLVNLYGTTEVTGDVTCAVFRPETPAPEARVPLGVSMAGAGLHVLDAQGASVPDGEPGELYVTGPVLARGYHHRPQEEAVRFPRLPTDPSERAFRTGDLVRRAPDGALLYLGRADDLVKIRGVRIELGEIERGLRAACPALGDIAVVLADGGERLVAFVAPAETDLDALHAASERLFPAVMRPGRFIPIASLPLLPNGKCDRRALAARVSAVRRELAPERLPQTPTERHLASLWSPLLRRDDIARDDSFASLGGDSLALAELLLALENSPRNANVELGLARDGTLEAVARALDGGGAQTAHTTANEALTLTPLGAEGARDAKVIAMLVEASMDAALCAATELPGRMSEERARAYCLASDGVALRVNGEPVGAGLVQYHPNVGEGVEVPPGGVQLDEWLLPRWRGRGLLGEGRAWPLLAEWLARRFDTEVSVVWEDHLAMLTILRARGYTRLGRTYWKSAPDGDGTEGYCEVWTYDLRPHRRASER